MSVTVVRRLCPACGHNKGKVLYRPKHSPGPVNRCPYCGMVYVSPIEDAHAIIDRPLIGDLDISVLNSNNLIDVADCWELALLPSEAERWVPTIRNATVALDLIDRFRQPPGSLLDFGCGWGFFLGAAKERGWKPHGLDPLPGHAIHARAKFGATVITDILRDDTFPQNSFDVVTSFQVFEHLPDPAGDLDSLYRVIKPGGVLLIEVPNIDTWSVRIFREHHRHFVQDHLNFFSSNTLRNLLESKSFKVKRIYFPTRYITVRHLIGRWFGKYLSKSMIVASEKTLNRLGLWEKVIGFSLGDIIAVIALKS